jgi:predicted dehydrogenase
MAQLHPLQIAVAGAGQIGKRHIELILASDACALHSIIDPSPAAAQLALQLSVPHFPSLEDLFHLPNHAHRPEGMVLATPNPLHVPQALQCLAQGIACLVEKPIASFVADA